MAHGDFIWCDLSTFDLDRARRFYAELFGWEYHETTGTDGSTYLIAYAGDTPAAGIFVMPEKFQAIGMPSFWMSYIAVDDIRATIDTASASGAKVELGPVPFDEGAEIALIRDPLGAGFTACQGGDFTPRGENAGSGQMAWNALYVSDAGAVAPFYERLFGWQMSADAGHPGSYGVSGSAGRRISDIRKADTSLRGEFEFWGIHFQVPDRARAEQKIGAGGGEVTYRSSPSEPVMASDPDGAAFFIV